MKKLGLGNQCLLALVAGITFGHFASNDLLAFITPFGEAFLKLLRLVIVPLTFSTIVASFSKLGHISYVKKLGISTLFWFLLTAIIASSIGVGVGFILAPGNGLYISNSAASSYMPRDIPSISSTLLNMVPGNLIGEISEGKVIPVIIFALFFGIALTSLYENGQNLRVFFDEFSQTMFKITRVIIRLSPIGIFALTAKVGHDYGLDMLYPLGKFIFAIYAACFLQLIAYMLLVIFVARKNPITFIREFWPAMIMAFTTSSTLGTLPVSLECLVDRVKIRERVAGFVAPLGATMKMDGCGAIYPAIVCVLTANILHIDLSIQQYILIILTSTIATIGTAGVPGTASIMATVVLTSVGLPLEGMALVIGIDKIVDMMRTLTNVTGSGVCALIVDKRYKE
ncbi:MAG: dicarboxylate/amino acid:cation symporter [Proteobacteria bacterium]|jgi:Na+/H+-dicarboxylate symporter|nr:dicarboxylate/amino acid:cation symporter [Pseudomonadota bacterium]